MRILQSPAFWLGLVVGTSAGTLIAGWGIWEAAYHTGVAAGKL